MQRFTIREQRALGSHESPPDGDLESPGARAYYDLPRARGKTHNQALRALANRLVGILHGCLRHRHPYDEAVAWPSLIEKAA